MELYIGGNTIINLKYSYNIDHVHVLRSGLSPVSASFHTIHDCRNAGLGWACSFRIRIVESFMLCIFPIRSIISIYPIKEGLINIRMSMAWVCNSDVMFMVLLLILLQSELFLIRASPEESLLIVKIWSEHPSPG